MEFFNTALEFFRSLLHIDVTLIQWAREWGPQLYLILFVIIFAETGLVFCPFLPGDSLLFAVGALSANPDFLKIETIIPLLISAAVIGDSVNYYIGRRVGRSIFERDLFFLKKSYLTSTEEFFKKRGIWAVSLSRFFPILRTIAPFFAGMSLMKYGQFVLLSFLGSVVWVFTFALAGYFFGQIEIIQKNFTYLVFALIIIPGLPVALNVFKALLKRNSGKTS